MSEQEFDREPAPEGKIWRCGACGKTAKVRWAFSDTSSWDEACMLNAYLEEVKTIEVAGTTASNYR